MGKSSVRDKTGDIEVSHALPVAAVEDDEPDAPTEVPQTHAALGPAVAVPELTRPGELAALRSNRFTDFHVDFGLIQRSLAR